MPNMVRYLNWVIRVTQIGPKVIAPIQQFRGSNLISGQQDLNDVSDVSQPQDVRVLDVSRRQRSGQIAVEQRRQAERHRDEDPKGVELEDGRVGRVHLEQRRQQLEAVASDDLRLAEV